MELHVHFTVLQGNPLMQQLAPMPHHQGNPNGHIRSGMGGRGRGRDRTRGGGGQRRSDYHGPRHMQQQLQLPPQQQQQLQPDGTSPAPNAMQLQPDQMVAQQPPEAQLQPVSYYAPHPYAAYGGYQGTYFAPHHGPIQAPPTAGATPHPATSTPLYISPIPFYNGAPMYNYMSGYFYQPLLPPSEYQYMPDDGGQPQGGVVDDRQMWHPTHMYAEDYQEMAHANGDELNHNSSTLTSPETSSMLSPNYPMYDTQQMHEIQQQMGVMQVYDDGQLAPLQAMHPIAAPVPQVSDLTVLHNVVVFMDFFQQYDDELSECGAAQVGGMPAAWTLPADGPPQPILVQAVPSHHIIQSQPQPTICIEQQQQQQQLPVQPPQTETPTPQAPQETLGKCHKLIIQADKQRFYLVIVPIVSDN